MTATDRATELKSSYGYSVDYHVEKYWRDVGIIQLWEGGGQPGRPEIVRGNYGHDQFRPNVMYEKVRELDEG